LISGEFNMEDRDVIGAFLEGGKILRRKCTSNYLTGFLEEVKRGCFSKAKN